MNSHEHHFEHLETRYIRYDRAYGNTGYKRIDRYFCTKCCEERVKEEYDNCGYIPDWFNSKSCENKRD